MLTRHLALGLLGSALIAAPALMLWTAPTQRWGSMAASSSQEPRSSP